MYSWMLQNDHTSRIKLKYTLMAEFSTYLYAAVDLATNFFTVFLETTQGLEPHLIRFWDFVWYTFVKLQRNSFLLIVYAYSKPFVVADYKKKVFSWMKGYSIGFLLGDKLKGLQGNKLTWRKLFV